jgi:hypothetical protein
MAWEDVIAEVEGMDDSDEGFSVKDCCEARLRAAARRVVRGIKEVGFRDSLESMRIDERRKLLA